MRELVSHADAVMEDKTPDLVRMWLFADNGLTGPAQKFARERGALWSSHRQFNALLEYLGLRKLPNL